MQANYHIECQNINTLIRCVILSRTTTHGVLRRAPLTSLTGPPVYISARLTGVVHNHLLHNHLQTCFCRPDGLKKAYVRLHPDYDALDVANKIGII